MKNIKKYIALLLLTTIVVSCSSNDSNDDGTNLSTDEKISYLLQYTQTSLSKVNVADLKDYKLSINYYKKGKLVEKYDIQDSSEKDDTEVIFGVSLSPEDDSKYVAFANIGGAVYSKNYKAEFENGHASIQPNNDDMKKEDTLILGGKYSFSNKEIEENNNISPLDYYIQEEAIVLIAENIK